MSHQKGQFPGSPVQPGPLNQSAEPSCSNDRPQRQRGRTVEHGGEGEKGTAFSNTVPNNCNSDYFKALRWGVDSLYLSYPGEIFPEADAKLKDLKKTAQSPEDHERVLAQYPIDGHIFEVKDKGTRFPPASE